MKEEDSKVNGVVEKAAERLTIEIPNGEGEFVWYSKVRVLQGRWFSGNSEKYFLDKEKVGKCTRVGMNFLESFQLSRKINGENIKSIE